MRVKITKSKAKGTVAAPPSKSMAHRLLICASMAEGVSTIHGVSDCEDGLATLDCLSSMGIKYDKCKDKITLRGKKLQNRDISTPLNCRESGSTIRFMIPSALAVGTTTVLEGAPRLMQRPMDVYEKLCGENGLYFKADGQAISVCGPLKSGEYEIAGNISSQFISGLLFALPCLDGDSRIRILPPVESKPYINMTIDALSAFGVSAVWEDDSTIFIKGSQIFVPTEISVEGDYSGSAFLEALNLFGSDVTVTGLKENSLQADEIYKEHFKLLSRGVPTIRINDCPDLAPILFACAGAKQGGIFEGTARLKIKESDRSCAMAEELQKFGISVEVYDDKVVVDPKEFHAPTEILNSHNDHRIVMALSVLLTLTGGEIDGAEAVSKSYPRFFEDLNSLGIEVTTYDV